MALHAADLQQGSVAVSQPEGSHPASLQHQISNRLPSVSCLCCARLTARRGLRQQDLCWGQALAGWRWSRPDGTDTQKMQQPTLKAACI